MDEDALTAYTDELSGAVALTGAQRETAKLALWRLLASQAARYTMGDSSSLPVETAEELLKSLRFTLLLSPALSAELPGALLTGDLSALLERAQHALEASVEEGKRLWRVACLSAPALDNLSLKSTLRGIGTFFDRYHWRFFAHEIPGEIDYQLCLPVEAQRLGIAYINDYLRRLNAENALLRRFEPARVGRVLSACSPDDSALLMNLCEPVLACAAGLALLGEDARALCYPADGRERLAAAFRSMREAEAGEALAGAANRLCGQLGVEDAYARDYAAHVAQALCPRVYAALPTGNLDGVFHCAGAIFPRA